MRTQFKPRHTATYNCLEDVLECIATGFKREHIMIYKDAWDFNFFQKSLGDNKIIGNRVESGEYNAWNSLAQYHGVRSKCHFTSKRDKQMQVLITELEKKSPVVLWLDGYYVPWTNVFEKLHMKHFIVAVDIDQEKEIIHVVDPYWNKRVNELSFDFFHLSQAKCITFTLEDQPEILWKQVVSERVKAILDREYTAFDAMRDFARETRDNLVIADEIRGFETLKYNCPLLMQLAEVFYKRLNYSNILLFLGKHNEVDLLIAAAEKIKEAGERWREYREVLVHVVEGKEDESKIKVFADKVMALADFEETVAKSLWEVSQ